MTEIKIEQKKQAWPWIVAGLVIAALLVYFLVFRDDTKITEADTETELVTEAESNSNTNKPDLIGVQENNVTVAAFVTFVENSNEMMGLDHDYTNDALLKLTAATNAMADEIGYDIQADLQKVKDAAVLITKEPFETSHAKNIRNATDKATAALQNMQQAKYPGLADEVTALKRASASINPEVLTLEQKDAVKNYFAKAADLLKKMN
ncbi:MAG: hypothetical protein PF694_09980 [Bacteroidetes bacterium]|jgi:hypothetical protein|nr:hypothetical protein [Bacteroidota bacterium]